MCAHKLHPLVLRLRRARAQSGLGVVVEWNEADLDRQLAIGKEGKMGEEKGEGKGGVRDQYMLDDKGILQGCFTFRLTVPATNMSFGCPCECPVRKRREQK